jgi:hypothetical protein
MIDMSVVTKEWIPVAEAAQRIGCHPRTVLRLAECGKIRRFQVNPRMYLVFVKDVARESKQAERSGPGRPRGS